MYDPIGIGIYVQFNPAIYRRNYSSVGFLQVENIHCSAARATGTLVYKHDFNTLGRIWQYDYFA